MRWLSLLLILALPATLDDCTPERADATMNARVEAVSDTTLRVITTWGYQAAPNGGYPDSTRLKVGLGQTPPTTDKGHFVLWPQVVDTSLVAVSAYGTIAGYACVVPHRREQWGAQTCKAWQFVRPDVTVPPYDTLTVRLASIIVRPIGMQIDPDVDGACAAWQRANPDRSPWVVVNQQAVPDCTGPNGAPTVAQFCAFGRTTQGATVKLASSWNIPICETMYQQLLAVRDT